MGKGLGPEGATARQRACYEMRKSGSTWEEIGLAMGCALGTARALVKAAERHGLPPLPKHEYQRKANTAGPEGAKRAAESLGEVVTANGAFDMKKFLDIAGAAGLHPKLAMALGRRVQMNYGPVNEELKSMTLAERVADITAKADLVASYIDAASIAGMNAKDLALAWKLLIDGAQLLGGKPTQIVDFNVRQRIEVLMPQMLAEAKRRGITLEGEFSHVPAHPALPDRSVEVEADRGEHDEYDGRRGSAATQIPAVDVGGVSHGIVKHIE